MGAEGWGGDVRWLLSSHHDAQNQGRNIKSWCQDELWRGPSFLHHILRPRFPHHNNVEHRFTMQLFPFVSANQRENLSVTSIKIHNRSPEGQRANKSLSRESAADYSRLICFLYFFSLEIEVCSQ